MYPKDKVPEPTNKQTHTHTPFSLVESLSVTTILLGSRTRERGLGGIGPTSGVAK